MTVSPPPASGHPNSLPPLHQVAHPPLNLLNVPLAYLDAGDRKAIPEFHSHNPHERRSSSVPRKLAGRGSPSFRPPPPRLASPPSSNAISDAGSMAAFPYYYSLEAHVATPSNFYPDLFLTGNPAVAAHDPMEGTYDAQTYMFPAHLESRRIVSASAPQSHAGGDSRPSPYLPSVSSLTSSRGSSFDMDHSDRPPSAIAAPLPLLYSAHHHQPGPSSYAPQYEQEAMRSQQTTPDYNRYSSGSGISPSPYQSSSPIAQYSQPYYSTAASYASQPRPHAGYPARQPGAPDVRSPFSPQGHVGDLSLDHFEQNRPGKRRRGNLPKQVTDLLRSWLNDHLHHPYPTEDEKQMLMAQTGLTIHQVGLPRFRSVVCGYGLLTAARSATGSSMRAGAGSPPSRTRTRDRRGRAGQARHNRRTTRACAEKSRCFCFDGPGVHQLAYI